MHSTYNYVQIQNNLYCCKIELELLKWGFYYWKPQTFIAFIYAIKIISKRHEQSISYPNENT